MNSGIKAWKKGGKFLQIRTFLWSRKSLIDWYKNSRRNRIKIAKNSGTYF